jgi:hypothetical protein
VAAVNYPSTRIQCLSISLPLDAKYISDGYNKFLDTDGYPAIQPPWTP